MQVTVETRLYELLEQHARSALPLEACGLLGVSEGPGEELLITGFVPTPNTARGVDQFAIDPLEIARADARLRSDGLRLGATFHSHPDSRAVPSASDQASCGPGLVHLILSFDSRHGGSQLTAWRHLHGQLRALPLRVCAPAQRS